MLYISLVYILFAVGVYLVDDDQLASIYDLQFGMEVWQVSSSWGLEGGVLTTLK